MRTLSLPLRPWRNWQTRQVQVLVRLNTSCRFDSYRPHSDESPPPGGLFSLRGSSYFEPAGPPCGDAMLLRIDVSASMFCIR